MNQDNRRQATAPVGVRTVLGAVVPFLVPLVLVLSIAAGASALIEQTQAERERAREEATSGLRLALDQASAASVSYMHEQASLREARRNALNERASNVAGQVLVHLQASLSRREARIADERARQAAEEQTRLQQLFQEQGRLLEKYREELRRREEEGTDDDTGTERRKRESRSRSRGKSKSEALPAELMADLEAVSTVEVADAVDRVAASEEVFLPQVGDSAPPETASNRGSSFKLPAHLQPDDLPSELPRSLPKGSITSRFDPAANWPERLLLETGPDLRGLLPENAALSIMEASAGGGKREVFHLGDVIRSRAFTGSAIRDLDVETESGSRAWTIGITIQDPAAPGPARAGELAALLTETLDMASGTGAAVRGLLVDENDRVIEVFPMDAPSAEVLPQTRPGEWLVADEASPDDYTLLLLAPAQAPCSWAIALQTVLTDPPVKERLQARVARDRMLLGALAGAALAVIVSLVYACHAGYRSLRPSRAGKGSGRKPSLVRQASGATRVVRENAQVIMAEVNSGGAEPEVALRELPRRKRVRSLQHLQALHRGAGAAAGSRILDHAPSPVLRELAKRVRPRQRKGEMLRREPVSPSPMSVPDVGVDGDLRYQPAQPQGLKGES